MLRAILAFIALPGVVAFAVPIAIGTSAGRPAPYWAAGLVPLGAGTLLLLWCVREFYVAGRGTLAPWAPPKQLVISGPYRYSRNPMYVGVVAILLGWTTIWGSRALLIYLIAVFCAFHLRVVFAEEPWAARRFGSDWDAYRARVPRWLL
jgi:protein-S-isoprenylcysteine O-methyltransferase Ste14